MKHIVILFILIIFMVFPASALEYSAPIVPESGQKIMPKNTDSFGEGILEIISTGFNYLIPELKNAVSISMKILCIVLLVSILQNISSMSKRMCELAGSLGIAVSLLGRTGTMISLGLETVSEITAYAKLLLPVLAGTLAAQGGVVTSGVLYAGTAMFNSVIASCVISVLIPGIRLFLAVSVVNSIVGEELLRRLADGIKSVCIWILKTLMMVFTTYLGITGVVSGTTDTVTLKAAKVAISSVVPVVGGILSDASEAVLISAAMAKNAAGIYGILVVFSITVQPFVSLLSHYLVLKLTGVICSILGSKPIIALIDCFSAVMGILLAITAGGCIMALISTVCFLGSVQ